MSFSSRTFPGIKRINLPRTANSPVSSCHRRIGSFLTTVTSADFGGRIATVFAATALEAAAAGATALTATGLATTGLTTAGFGTAATFNASLAPDFAIPALALGFAVELLLLFAAGNGANGSSDGVLD